jgi:hypothetical protein
MKKTPVSRLNIYLPDQAVRRQVKTAAAKHDMSVSEYCVQAIASQLAQDQELPKQEGASSLLAAVRRARRFQQRVFHGRRFTVSSAELIREARAKRSGNA